ncbi:MAG TPA: putative glycoside hydrolase [Candidatus Acidoferrum sp.]|nr:putative glycoside hydrolase [Candidatus Acidoferrum sp.]
MSSNGAGSSPCSSPWPSSHSIRRARAAIAHDAPRAGTPAGPPSRVLIAALLAILAAGITPGASSGPTARSLDRPADGNRPTPAGIKAVYLSYYGVADATIRGRVLDLLDRTELNAVVIDVKGDRGFIPYATSVDLAVHAGARGPVRWSGFDVTLQRLKARGIYTIARIVVFKDDVLARYRPGWALLDRRTGQPWVDQEGLAWIDPFKSEAWAYALQIAREAAAKGFDEIQFDYLRFPSEGALGAIRYSAASTQQTRTATIGRFLAAARQELGDRARLAIDVFGYTAFNDNDTNVGQRIEELATLVDVICPMAYPSAYHGGIPGYRNPVAHPYEVVAETVRRIQARSRHTHALVRPWIQDFRDYAFDRRAFGPIEVGAQIRAARDAGASGWMLWNPRNRYTVEALRSPG